MPAISFDVFISYSRRDQSFVDWLENVLDLAAVRSFRDTTDLEIFDRLDASLKKNIANARWLIAIISPSYLNSYWCMFEAIEAVQGQDREQRFLPLILRYTPDDQSLDEGFVLTALDDLAHQINDFEQRLVKARAYELSTKLDKLNYVRANLPRVFNHIQERLYPQFDLWNEPAMHEAALRLLRRLKPDIPTDLVLPLVSIPSRAPAVASPRLQPMPRILWSSKVGHCARTNSPLISGNEVFIGTAGVHWNQPDDQDGIRCLDAETGAQKWFTSTPADTNQLLLTKGLIVAGCDDGTLVALNSRDGAKRWKHRIQDGVIGKPLRLPVFNWRENRHENVTEPLLIVSYSGCLHVINLLDGRELQKLELGSPILAVPLLINDGTYPADGYVIVPSIDGILYFVSFAGGRLTDVATINITYRYSAGSILADDPPRIPSLGTEPILHEKNKLLIPFARDTSDASPPLVAIDLQTRQLIWRSGDPEGLANGFGNIRGTPVITNGEVIFSTAYSNALTAVSLETGAVTWQVELGTEMFEQWPGPITDGADVYLGRHDGYVHKINLKVRRREWSLFLGAHDRAGATIAGDQTLPEFQEFPSWLAGNSAPILATPALDRGRLYIGTSEGWLYSVGNLGA
jgi:outer membrane protein assembly factor BamB